MTDFVRRRGYSLFHTLSLVSTLSSPLLFAFRPLNSTEITKLHQIAAARHERRHHHVSDHPRETPQPAHRGWHFSAHPRRLPQIPKRKRSTPFLYFPLFPFLPLAAMLSGAWNHGNTPPLLKFFLLIKNEIKCNTCPYRNAEAFVEQIAGDPAGYFTQGSAGAERRLRRRSSQKDCSFAA